VDHRQRAFERSMQQHMIANNYPGLLDAIVPTASSPTR
jgi:hypothetical protein